MYVRQPRPLWSKSKLQERVLLWFFVGLAPELGLKVPWAPKWFSGSFSYSTCTNDFGAATHNERRFQFRLFNRLFRIVPGFMGKSRIHRWWSPSELETETRSGTWAKRFYLWRLLSRCRAPLTNGGVAIKEVLNSRNPYPLPVDVYEGHYSETLRHLRATDNLPLHFNYYI